MGLYLNPDDEKLKTEIISDTYVDKSGIISVLSPLIGLEDRKYVCISRPRRFGKTWTADMLRAYYSRGADSKKLFDALAISKDASYLKHLNQYDLVYLDIADFYRANEGDVPDMIQDISRSVTAEIGRAYPESEMTHLNRLHKSLESMFNSTRRRIIFIIDEWDHVLREAGGSEAQKPYIEFLNLLLRNKAYVGLCYMTGILPIKKYKGQSTIGFFREFSMTDPGNFAPFVGFTQVEVKALCDRFGKDFEKMRAHYDGYRLPGVSSVYCPLSVTRSILDGGYKDYWSRTDTFTTLSDIINQDRDGVKDDVVRMLAGGTARVDTSLYQNDLNEIRTRDDVLTALVHLGYLGFEADPDDERVGETFIPNIEVSHQYKAAASDVGMPRLEAILSDSRKLLESTIAKDGAAVASALDEVHSLETSVLKYNDENSLACAIDIAYFAAKEHYVLYRELPAGKGFADIVFIPLRAYPDKPALVVELKWDESADSAIRQIRERRYAGHLRAFSGRVLLVGINYDKATKRHECQIDELTR